MYIFNHMIYFDDVPVLLDGFVQENKESGRQY